MFDRYAVMHTIYLKKRQPLYLIFQYRGHIHSLKDGVVQISTRMALTSIDYDLIRKSFAKMHRNVFGGKLYLRLNLSGEFSAKNK